MELNNEEQEYWQLNKFAAILDKHATTVNDWFTTLEDRKIHYISRGKDRKRIYDTTDLALGQYINTMRDKGWQLSAIFDHLEDRPEDVELRPFPPEMENESAELSASTLQKHFNDMSSEIASLTVLVQQLVEQNQHLAQQQMLRLQEPEEDRDEAIRLAAAEQNILEYTLNKELTLEALDEWSQLPEAQRLIKAGLFRKEEDTAARERYVQQYLKDHYPDRLRAQLKQNRGE